MSTVLSTSTDPVTLTSPSTSALKCPPSTYTFWFDEIIPAFWSTIAHMPSPIIISKSLIGTFFSSASVFLCFG